MNVSVMSVEFLPPRVMVKVSGGEWLLGREGQVVVQPGSKVQLDCVFKRQKGTPEWSWPLENKEYPTGALS